MTDSFNRIILHADMDAFFAAVEQLDHPELRGKPVIIGSRSPRSVVSTCSYEARIFGVGSAMPMFRALRCCPHAEVVPPRMDRYAQVSRQIMGVFGRFSPLVEPLSIDEAFIDMTGAARLWGTPEQMGRGIKASVVEATGGLTVSVGIASTKFVAKVASDMQKPDGLTIVPPSQVKAFLDPLPVSKIWGAGPKTVERLERLGLRCIRDVTAQNEMDMARRFGAQGRQLWLLANGIDDRMVTIEREAGSIGREYTLESDVRGLDQIWPHLVHSADQIARALRRQRLRAGGVRLRLKTRDFRLLTRQGRLPEPTDSAAVLLSQAAVLMPKFDLNQFYRLVGMAVYQLSPSPEQEELLLSAPARKQRNLDAVVDRVLERFGETSLSRGDDVAPGNGKCPVQ